MADSTTVLWKHPDPASTRTDSFRLFIERKYGLELKDYTTLWQWSITNLNDFWDAVWHFTGVRASKLYNKLTIDKDVLFPRPAFFPAARLNFAENLLFPACLPCPESVAVIEANEVSRKYVTWRELREKVSVSSTAMRALGVCAGDRVVGYVGNHCDALVAMLAATSIGAVWSGISPDTGATAVIDRLQQIDPVILFSDNAIRYNGKTYDIHTKLTEIAVSLPKLRACVVFDVVPDIVLNASDIAIHNGSAMSHADFSKLGQQSDSIEFTQLPPDHPLYILFSSGTTGKPKCIVHGVAGTLIQHKKEHDIQCSMQPGDRLFYYTTCTWMMWHWLVSALATGVTIVLYDGSPFYSSEGDSFGMTAMPRLINELSISHFGTSAKYLSILEEKNVQVSSSCKLSSLKAIYSTGSPLAPSTFRFVYRSFGSQINLASITGGTDIISLFGAPSQISPVHCGEIQARGLGMAVQVWDDRGHDITMTGQPGELVCVRPFPCQPIGFWGKDGQEKYRQAYFEKYPGIWHHGDYVRINPETGGLQMLGRSDGLLKPAGVRFGSSEIYNLLQQFFPIIEDSLCVGRRRPCDSDEMVVLFVKLVPSACFSSDLISRIKAVVRKELSVRHVPGIIDATPEIPITINGKKVEVAVKQILCDSSMPISASIANIDCLQWYRQWNSSHP